MPGLIGKKVGMTSVFSADGKNVPCTVIEAGPCVVTQVKTVETDLHPLLSHKIQHYILIGKKYKKTWGAKSFFVS